MVWAVAGAAPRAPIMAAMLTPQARRARAASGRCILVRVDRVMGQLSGSEV
jgi:hypothetical protein